MKNKVIRKRFLEKRLRKHYKKLFLKAYKDQKKWITLGMENDESKRTFQYLLEKSVDYLVAVKPLKEPKICIFHQKSDLTACEIRTACQYQVLFDEFHHLWCSNCVDGFMTHVFFYPYDDFWCCPNKPHYPEYE